MLFEISWKESIKSQTYSFNIEHEIIKKWKWQPKKQPSKSKVQIIAIVSKIKQ